MQKQLIQDGVAAIDIHLSIFICLMHIRVVPHAALAFESGNVIPLNM